MELSFLQIIYFLFGLLISIPLLTVLINGTLGPYLRDFKKHKTREKKVSILVPARNEERNIARVLNSLILQKYPNLEIIILDDNSTDATAAIASEYALRDSKIKVLSGSDLAQAWLGKNWACKQLADIATGDILIFTDADNFHHPDAVSNTLSAMEKLNLDMLSAFPQQKTSSFWEKLIVPMIDLIVYSGLILWSSRYIPHKAFAAANGQWIAVKKDAYDKIGGHAAVKHHIVEDVALARCFKQKGHKTLVAAGTGIVFGKMYDSFCEIWFGLSKNLFGLTNFKSLPFLGLMSGLFAISLLPFILLFSQKFFQFALIMIAANLVWKILLAVFYKHNFLSVALFPLAALVFIAIGINSFIQSKWGELQWKGRRINVNEK